MAWHLSLQPNVPRDIPYLIGSYPIRMNRPVKQPPHTRSYHAPRRTAAALETRQDILRAAREEFETRGWAATTMRSIAGRAGVSPKTVEALFATKPALLEATLLTSLVGDPASTDTSGVFRGEVVLEMLGDITRDMEGAPDAATVLDLFSAAACQALARSARTCWTLETAVPTDERLADVWARAVEVQRFVIRRWAEILLQKPGVRADLTRREAEEALLITSDWNVHRSLTTTGGMTTAQFEAWTKRYHRRMVLE